MTVNIEYFPLGGGLNLVTPPLAIKSGELLGCMNYECLPEGGYSRIKGYEKYDGSATPAVVPGSGDILGVHIYKGEVYAIREDGTNARLYKETVSGWTEVTLPALWSLGGKYKFCNYNFYGQDSQEEMFIVNGVDKAIKYDGTAAVQITTGFPTTDAPSDVIGHKYHLFLAVESSIINSATGNPTDYQTGNGAAEIAVGDTINELSSVPNALMIGCKDSTKVLYGSDKNDWQLEHYNDTGVIPFTSAMIGGQALAMDRQGVFSLQTSQAYGNFNYSSVSRKAKPVVDTFRAAHEARSCLIRDKNQYRLFFGNQGLFFTFVGQQLSGITTVQYAHPVKCVTNGEDAAGDEFALFGSDDGYVYKMESTNYFDGAAINAYAQLAFNHSKSPSRSKRYRKALVDLRNQGDSTTFYILPSADYGGSQFSATAYGSELIGPSGGALWDFAQWDQFYWDSQAHNEANIRMSAIGANMGMIISNDGTTDSIHAIYGVTLHYSPRRLRR